MLSKNDISYSSIIYRWIGELKLCFGLRNAKTILLERWQRGPFYIQNPFYFEDRIPHIYLLHPPGGLVGGDYLSLKVDLMTSSQVLLTTPGASKFYRSNGSYVYLKQRFNLSKNSILEWLPQPNIFFPQTKVIIDCRLRISQGARFIFFETFCFGRLVVQELFRRSVLNIFLSIDSENFVGLRERVRINYSDEPLLNKFYGCQISATLFAMPCDFQILDDVRILISAHNVSIGGATLLGDLLVVRLLDNDNELIKKVLHNLWCFLRPIIVMKQPVIPRIWLT